MRRTKKLNSVVRTLALLPFIVLLSIAFLAPIARMLSRSFLEPIPGLTNFQSALADPLYHQVFLTTFRITIEVTLVSILLAFPIATLAVKAKPLFRNIVFAFVLIPFWTSLLVRVYGWTVILQRTGVINQTLQDFGLTQKPLPLFYNEFAVVLGITHYMLPFMIFAIYVALKGIDDRLVPAAATLGSRPLRTFFKVTFPLALPGVLGGGAIVFIGTLGFFVTPALMGSPSQMMIANLISFQAKEALNWAMASTISCLLILIVAALGWWGFRFSERNQGEVVGGAT